MKVFISSTFLDLRKHRERVIETLQSFGEQYTAMEIFGARSEEPKTVSLEEVNECDFLIGIYAHRYGWIPEGDEFSITQQEYELARKIGKETLCYVVDSDYPWPPKWIDEGEKKKKLEKFKKKIKKETTPDRFTTPESLVPKISGNLARVIVNLGKAKAEDFDLLPNPPMPYFAHPYPLQKNFTGREKEREMLSGWYTRGPHPMLAITAIGGMGKTALTWYWLQEDILKGGKAHEGVIWWSFYERESSFENFLESAIRYASGGEIDPKTITSMRERVDTLVQLLFKTRFLLVLDGVECVLRAYASLGASYMGDDVKKDERGDYRTCVDPNVGTLLRELASSYPQTKTLITSRLFPRDLDSLEGCREKKLEKMDKADAVTFFRRQGVKKGTRAEIEAACEPYDYLPLALRLLSGTLATDPEYKGDIKYACEIPVLELADDLKGEDLDARKLAHILEFVYDRLPKEDQEFMSQLAAFRSPMKFEALYDIFGNGQIKKAIKKRLQDLEKRGLLLYSKEKYTYDLHPVVRRHCYSKLTTQKETHEKIAKHFEQLDKSTWKYPYQELPEDKIKQITKIGEHIDKLPEGKQKEFKSIASSLIKPQYPQPKSIDDLQPVIELYHHTVGAGRYDEAYELWRDRLWTTLFYQLGAYQIQIELLNALFVNDELRLKDDAKKGKTYNELANSYSLSGQPRRAVPLLQLGNEPDIAAIKKVFPSFNWEDTATYPKGEDAKKVPSDLKNLAIGLGNLAASGQLPIGDLESAESNLQRAIKIGEEIKDDFEIQDWNRVIGICLSYLGNFDNASEHLSISNKIAQKNNHYQWISSTWASSSLHTRLMNDPAEGLRCAEKALKFAKKQAEDIPVLRDFIQSNYYIGVSYVAMKKSTEAEPYLNFAITECRKINLVDIEALILLELAKLEYLRLKTTEPQSSQRNNTEKREPLSEPLRALCDSVVKLTNEALEIANRSGYVLQQADIHLFLAEFYEDLGDIDKARENAELAKLRSHQMIDVETGDYITKPEDTKWKYKPCYNKAVALIESMT